MKKAIGSLIFLLVICFIALFIGLVLPVFPVKLSLGGVGLVLAGLGFMIIFLLPDSKTVPYRLIYFCFFVVVFTRFLWPNFAYIPIPALPTKNPQRLLWALGLCFWVYSLATNPELRQRLTERCTRSKIVWLVFALFAWRTLTAATSEYPFAALQPVFLELFEYLPALLFALTWIRDENDALRMAHWLVLAALVITALTAVEVARQSNLFLSITPYDPNNAEFLQTSLESKMRGGAYRAQASFNHPLLLAQFMAVVLPLMLLSAWNERSKLARGLALLALLALPFVLWASRTRTSVAVALVVLGVALLAATFVRLRPPVAAQRGRKGDNSSILAGIALLVLMALAAAAAFFIIQLAIGRTAEESVSSGARVQMLQRAIAGTAKNPVLGLGPGIGGAEAASVNSRGISSLDSYPLILMLDSGLPAIAAYLALVTAGSLGVLRLMGDGSKRHKTIGAFGLSVLAFGITSLVLGTAHNLPLFYLALGVIVALSDAPARAKQRSTALYSRGRTSPAQ